MHSYKVALPSYLHEAHILIRGTYIVEDASYIECLLTYLLTCWHKLEVASRQGKENTREVKKESSLYTVGLH